VLESQETTPETLCFPAAAQIAKLRRRVRRDGKLSTETLHLISSAPREHLCANGLQAAKREYWSIESALRSGVWP
jgi:hypothetical protein